MAEPASAEWLWQHLPRAFPDAVASELMPDHLHGLVPDADAPLLRLARVLRHHCRKFGTRWDIGPATPVHTVAIARRTARYIILNPVRSQLVHDPLEWPWSSLRDVVGATADPWAGADVIASHLGFTSAQFHAYVAADATCSPTARFPPSVLHPDTPMAVSLAAIAEACAAALRSHPAQIRTKGSRMRATFVALAYRVGAPRQTDLAAACGVTTRTVRLLRSAADPTDLRAALRCLTDPRLRHWCTPTDAQRPKRAG